jgi:hypothetical protein
VNVCPSDNVSVFLTRGLVFWTSDKLTSIQVSFTRTIEFVGLKVTELLGKVLTVDLLAEEKLSVLLVEAIQRLPARHQGHTALHDDLLSGDRVGALLVGHRAFQEGSTAVEHGQVTPNDLMLVLDHLDNLG